MTIKFIYQIDTATLRWENTGGNTMILSAKVWIKHVRYDRRPSVIDVEKYWVLAGPDGVGFYNTVDNPLDEFDSDYEPVDYYDFTNVANGLEIPEAKFADINKTMTTLYNGFMDTNDFRTGF